MPMDWGLDALIGGVLGLLVGSFLNVVIHRLPKMLERQWAAECAEFGGLPVQAQEPFNLLVPRSRCPQCGHVIRWYENIPVLSWLALRGRCSQCRKGSACATRWWNW
jgi:leader peptidase (prepilin peptidase) / N-methyltransferase